MMQGLVPKMARVVNGWMINTDTMGVYGNYYLKRAAITLVGLGANQAEDATYPLAISDGDGKPIDGNNDYVMHFTKAELPPVDAFWSITMYDAEGFQTANKINRYAIGDRDDLKYNADGSLDIYMQNGSPGADKESNWLPAQGPLGITMRLYAAAHGGPERALGTAADQARQVAGAVAGTDQGPSADVGAGRLMSGGMAPNGGARGAAAFAGNQAAMELEVGSAQTNG
jgi:hypothetical protein